MGEGTSLAGSPSGQGPAEQVAELDRNNGNAATATLVAPPQPSPAAAPEAKRPAHLAYNPALDGIRGLALSSVLLYHGYAGDWFKGSFLAVSTFFTLSGFLITSLLLTEHARSGGIALSSFYARRLRRLLPAPAATLAVVAISAVLTNEQWERPLGGDVFAAGLHVGPFACTGTVMLPADPFEKPGSNAILSRRILPVRDATVRCLDPAIGLPDEHSPLVFVHVTGLEALVIDRTSTG